MRPGGGVRDAGRLASVLALAVLAACSSGPAGDAGLSEAGLGPASVSTLDTIPVAEWRGLVQTLSEPGGFFDTDNLTSNEQSYLHVLGPMRDRGVVGGAYLGVGPDQNFSYMAEQRPWIAFIIDLRRDNLVHHLLLKALFLESETRLDYLSLLFGRGLAEPDPRIHDLPVDSLLERLEGLPGGPGTPEAEEALRRVLDRVTTLGLELDENALGTLERFHQTFIQEGPELRFSSFGREARTQYPTFATLLLERDLTGEQGSYLATRDDFLFVKALQATNRIIPVVGDLSGPSALREVGEEVRRRGLVVRAF